MREMKLLMLMRFEMTENLRIEPMSAPQPRLYELNLLMITCVETKDVSMCERKLLMRFVMTKNTIEPMSVPQPQAVCDEPDGDADIRKDEEYEVRAHVSPPLHARDDQRHAQKDHAQRHARVQCDQALVNVTILPSAQSVSQSGSDDAIFMVIRGGLDPSLMHV